MDNFGDDVNERRVVPGLKKQLSEKSPAYVAGAKLERFFMHFYLPQLRIRVKTQANSLKRREGSAF